MFMTEEKQNIQHTPFPPEEERRTEYVGAKVTPGQKRHIRRLADECGMTVTATTCWQGLSVTGRRRG